MKDPRFLSQQIRKRCQKTLGTSVRCSLLPWKMKGDGEGYHLPCKRNPPRTKNEPLENLGSWLEKNLQTFTWPAATVFIVGSTVCPQRLWYSHSVGWNWQFCRLNGWTQHFYPLDTFLYFLFSFAVYDVLQCVMFKLYWNIEFYSLIFMHYPVSNFLHYCNLCFIMSNTIFQQFKQFTDKTIYHF